MAKGGEESHGEIEKGGDVDDHIGDESVLVSNVDDMSHHSTSNSEVPAGVAKSCTSDCSFEVDRENGAAEIPVLNSPTEADRNCRICHLSLEGTLESGIPIDLGCSCKNVFAAAHKQCAETWFGIKGDKICEICGSMAKNVVCATAVLPASTSYGKSWWRHSIDAAMSHLLWNWLLTGDKRLLFLFFVFFFFYIVCEYVDHCKRTSNPSVAEPQEDSAS